MDFAWLLPVRRLEPPALDDFNADPPLGAAEPDGAFEPEAPDTRDPETRDADCLDADARDAPWREPLTRDPEAREADARVPDAAASLLRVDAAWLPVLRDVAVLDPPVLLRADFLEDAPVLEVAPVRREAVPLWREADAL